VERVLTGELSYARTEGNPKNQNLGVGASAAVPFILHTAGEGGTEVKPRFVVSKYSDRTRSNRTSSSKERELRKGGGSLIWKADEASGWGKHDRIDGKE